MIECSEMIDVVGKNEELESPMLESFCLSWKESKEVSSEVGKFRWSWKVTPKLENFTENFYGHLIKRQEWPLQTNFECVGVFQSRDIHEHL